MRDLKAELKLLKTCNLSTVKYSVDFAIEIMQRAVDAEAEVDRLLRLIKSLRDCKTCEYFRYSKSLKQHICHEQSDKLCVRMDKWKLKEG